MSARDWFRAIAKELRAVAPVWAAAVLAMAAVNARGGQYEDLMRGIGLGGFFVGPAAVAALAFGHDFNFGTWPMLLTLPVSRRRLLLLKFGVLTALLLLFVAFARWFGPLTGPGELDGYIRALPIVLGAFVAPWLALQTRRVLAGSVFAVALPGVLLFLGLIVGTRLHSASVDAVVAHVVFWGVSIACIAGAVLGWRRFTTLELIDGVPDGRAAARSRVSESRPPVARRNPVWNLFAKELRIQRITLGIAGCYALVYLVSALINGPRLQLGAEVGILTVVYGTLLAAMAGAVASAEERQLGTLDGELLLPVAVRRQWTIKAATALALAVGLGYGVPGLLFWLVPIPTVRIEPMFAGIVALVAALGLYVSSVSRTTLYAVILVFPLWIAVAMIFRALVDPVIRATNTWTYAWGGPFVPVHETSGVIVVGSVISLLTLFTVRLALSNHRYADRSPLRIAAHAALFVIAMTGGLAVLGALGIH